MKTDDFKTDVMFRKIKGGEDQGTIEAFFPYCIEDHVGNVLSYAHLGQHCTSFWDYVLFRTIPAKENEYKALKSELESIGYNLNIVKRRNYKRFLTELNKTRQR